MSRIKIYPPLLTLLLILTMAALHYALPRPLLIHPPFNSLGFVLIAAGVSMNLWPAWWFRSNQTTIDPRGNAIYLAQEGLYRVSRNPMYLGMLILLLGVSIYLGSLISFLAPPLFVWIVTVRFIRHEEQALLDCFGDEYIRYKARVRRWV
ncbi:MAG: isoprenylcysteine carboxylmethyltransferase family protein [Hydrogenophilales bacterium]|nr:isoprenylcysteine carboxylmethyltransferase family protein [Hydrogenophilales bacterium]